MILLPFKEVSIQSLANGFQKLELSGSRIWDFWPKWTKAVNTKPSYVMCSQFFLHAVDFMF